MEGTLHHSAPFFFGLTSSSWLLPSNVNHTNVVVGRGTDRPFSHDYSRNIELANGGDPLFPLLFFFFFFYRLFSFCPSFPSFEFSARRIVGGPPFVWVRLRFLSSLQGPTLQGGVPKLAEDPTRGRGAGDGVVES